MLDLARLNLLRDTAYVAEEWIGSSKTQAVYNPATAAAETAMKAWSRRTAKERAQILRRWFDLLLANQEDPARIMTAEQGKPFAEARGEILYAAAYIEWYAEEGKRAYGEITPSYASDKRVLTIKQAIGVCGAITPWTFPAAMITRKVAPALAAGCAIIVKPALETPLSAFALAVLAEEAGVPKGLFSVLTGDAAEIDGVLTSDPVVAKLSFTGSTEIGKLIMRQCAGTVKRVSLELGGNAPFIVFEDADLDEAVSGVMASKFRNAGQTCVCANRIYVQNGIYDAFLARLRDSVELLRVGDGASHGVEIGPLIDEDGVRKVESHVADALNQGDRLISGGKRHALGRGFFAPTIIADVTAEMLVAGEETFGPLAPIFRFNDETDVVAQAHATRSGLPAYFFTRDSGRVWRVGEALEYGIVGVNTGLVSTEVEPFGGRKESGTGREGSRHGLDDYLELKYLCIGGIDE